MHPVRCFQKNAALRCDGRFAIEQIVECRIATAPGVYALDRLAQLHLIAEQDQVFGAHAHGDHVGERDLSRFVDEEIVELTPKSRLRQQPSGAGNKLRRWVSLRDVLIGTDVFDEVAIDAVIVRRNLFHADIAGAGFLHLLVHRFQQVGNDFVAVRGHRYPFSGLKQCGDQV